jgi:cytochrome b
MPPVRSDTRIQVWDPLVRIGHWALATTFAVAYFTGEAGRERSDLHELAGYATGAIIAWRVVWGIGGPAYARFSGFVTGPRAALRYLIKLMQGSAPRYLGHNPAGGAMIFALLTCLALTVLTGLVGNRGRPPLAHGNTAVVAEAHAETLRHMLAEVHGALANLTFALVLIHIAGVLLACIAHRENLIWAMITGMKRREESPER